MRFRILGTLHVHSGSREVPITTVRERILLAMLLLNDGDRVSVPLLAEAIWADQLPRDAPNQVQKCVSRLRKHLAEAGIPRGILITDHGAYRLSVDSRQIDLHEFRGQWAEARTTAATGDLLAASERYRVALSIWRGPALTDIDSPRVRSAAAVLDEERLRSIEECIDVELALGKAGDLISELRELVQQYPYQERLHAALMLALYRVGRQADALATYRDVRMLLQEALGVEVSDDLRLLHRAILSHDP